MWIFMALIVGISEAMHGDEDYYGNTDYCALFLLQPQPFADSCTY